MLLLLCISDKPTLAPGLRVGLSQYSQLMKEERSYNLRIEVFIMNISIENEKTLLLSILYNITVV